MTKITPTLSPTAYRNRIVNVVRTDENGCWNWLGYLMPNGYAAMSVGNEKHYVHRLAYAAAVGEIPDGLHIDHLCRNRACCNPEHLEAVTQRVNNLRSESFAAKKYQQTECVNGHEFDALNTYIAPNGTRKCRTCRKAARYASYYRVKARIAA